MSSLDLPTMTGAPGELLADARIAALRRLARPGSGRSAKAIEQAAKDFESVLLQKLLDEMKNTIPDSGLLESPTGKQMQQLFWDHLARGLAEQGGVGLWKQLYRQWSAAAGLTASRPPQPPAVEEAR